MPIRSAITVSLTPEARGGPFVFWDDLPAACRSARELGFDAIELFAPGPHAVSQEELRRLLSEHGLQLAAVGTGAGWVIHRLQLCDPDEAIRRRAIDFIRSMIDFGGPFGASAIIGSMQGRWTDAVSKPAALDYLARALEELGDHAARHGVPLIYEPLNRYETNLVNTLADGVALLQRSAGGGLGNVRLLADLFHMNIEEADLSAAIRAAGAAIGHIHFVDSNRRPAGAGHTDFRPIAEALTAIGYEGYLSAEAFPLPNSYDAAALTIQTFRTHFR